MKTFAKNVRVTELVINKYRKFGYVLLWPCSLEECTEIDMTYMDNGIVCYYTCDFKQARDWDNRIELHAGEIRHRDGTFLETIYR